MLIMLLIIVLKKLNLISSIDTILVKVKKLAFTIIYLILIFVFANFTSDSAKKDVKNITFSIERNNTQIGFIKAEKYLLDESTIYDVNCEVNARVIVNFKAIGVEKSVYKNQKLVYSSVYRKVNKSVKLNHDIRYDEDKYIFRGKKGALELNIEPISQNLVKLFFFEPVGIKKVYSDKYKIMLDIIPLGNNKFKIEMPSGSYNIYHYENGECVLIEVIGTFFKVKLIKN